MVRSVQPQPTSEPSLVQRGLFARHLRGESSMRLSDKSHSKHARKRRVRCPMALIRVYLKRAGEWAQVLEAFS